MIDLIRIWFSTKFFSADRVERHFAYLIALQLSLTCCYLFYNPTGLGAPLCTFWGCLTIFFVLLGVWSEQAESRTKTLEISRFALFFLLLITVAVYYDGTNVVNRVKYAALGENGDSMLYDPMLVHWDTLLLGWLFPRGQLALYLDTSPTIGVTSNFGRLYVEILQVMYVSYYFWGNGIAAFWGYRYFYDGVYTGKNKSALRRVHWRRIQMFLCAWSGAFLFNFTLNLFLPAVSPRIYLKDYFTNEIHGLWLADKLRGAVGAAAKNTFSAFPSGHCGLSWVASVIAYRARMRRMFIPTTIAAVLISLATLVLRYHYFVDFLFGFWLVIWGAWLGGFSNEELFQRSLNYKVVNNGIDADDKEAALADGIQLLDVQVVAPEDDLKKKESESIAALAAVLINGGKENGKL